MVNLGKVPCLFSWKRKPENYRRTFFRTRMVKIFVAKRQVPISMFMYQRYKFRRENHVVDEENYLLWLELEKFKVEGETAPQIFRLTEEKYIRVRNSHLLFFRCDSPKRAWYTFQSRSTESNQICGSPFQN